MGEVIDFFTKLFDTSDWPPRWHCGNWTNFHGWLYIISDLLIWGAYFAIPIIIIRYISRKKHAKFIRLYFLFASFILACGATHFMDAAMFWFPAYRLSALLRLITAVVSWLTVFSLLRLLPFAFSLKSNDEFEREIEQRKKTESELKDKNEQLTKAEVIAGLGHWRWNIVTGELFWSENLKRMFEFAEQPSYEKYIQHIHDEDLEATLLSLEKALKTGVFDEFYHRVITATGKIKVLHSRADVVLGQNNEVIEIIGTAHDITRIMHAQQALEAKTTELEASNFELEKFMHVASHDLQEPLRKIATYGMLLQDHAKSMLDEKGHEYLSKMVLSSQRMRNLINALVSFSLVKQPETLFEATDLNIIIQNVISDLELKIQATQTKLEVGPLPVIEANKLQLEQLFQNIISNSIKFQANGQAPLIKIYAELILDKKVFPTVNSTEDYYKITVEDNGIGFEETYLQEIFGMFKRLNTNYQGTGLGLAICKRIVDNHNGFITAESKPGVGSKFMVILPVTQHRNL